MSEPLACPDCGRNRIKVGPLVCPTCDQREPSNLAWERMYFELVDALMSKGWAPRESHEAVLALAQRMKARELKIRPMAAAECQSCRGYGYFDDSEPTIDTRCRKCSDCQGTGHA